MAENQCLDGNSTCALGICACNDMYFSNQTACVRSEYEKMHQRSPLFNKKVINVFLYSAVNKADKIKYVLDDEYFLNYYLYEINTWR